MAMTDAKLVSSVIVVTLLVAGEASLGAIIVDDFEIASFLHTVSGGAIDSTQPGLNSAIVIGGERVVRVFAKGSTLASMELTVTSGEDGVVLSTSPTGGSGGGSNQPEAAFFFRYGTSIPLDADLSSANAFLLDVTTSDTDWFFRFEGASDDVVEITGSGTYLYPFALIGMDNNDVDRIRVDIRTPMTLAGGRMLTLNSIQAVSASLPPIPDPDPIPEPSTVAIWSLLGFSLMVARRRFAAIRHRETTWKKSDPASC